MGSAARQPVAAAGVLAKKPARVSFTEAATVPQSGVIALQSTRDQRSLKKGDRVLINGAGAKVMLLMHKPNRADLESMAVFIDAGR